MAPVGTAFHGLQIPALPIARRGVMAIKPSGVPHEELAPESTVVVDLESGTDHRWGAPTFVRHADASGLYREFERVGDIVHTHSPFATAWAQACREIPCLGTTHADHFNAPVAVTRALTPDEKASTSSAPARSSSRRSPSSVR